MLFATSLTFVSRSFSSAFKANARSPASSEHLPPLSANILAVLLDPAEETDAHAIGTQAEVLSIDGDSGGGFQSSLRQQENGAEEHAAVALVAAKKRSVFAPYLVKLRA